MLVRGSRLLLIRGMAVRLQQSGTGLGVAPQLIIVKQEELANSGNWPVYHRSLRLNTGGGYLSLKIAQDGQFAILGTIPRQHLQSLLSGLTLVCKSSENFVAYCFAPVAGYSSFGSYTGNGSADGPFVYTGFRPRWVMVKCTGTQSGDEWPRGS
jgi:hypothetical protein